MARFSRRGCSRLQPCQTHLGLGVGFAYYMEGRRQGHQQETVGGLGTAQVFHSVENCIPYTGPTESCTPMRMETSLCESEWSLSKLASVRHLRRRLAMTAGQGTVSSLLQYCIPCRPAETCTLRCMAAPLAQATGRSKRASAHWATGGLGIRRVLGFWGYRDGRCSSRAPSLSGSMLNTCFPRGEKGCKRPFSLWMGGL